MTRRVFPIDRSWLYNSTTVAGAMQREFDDSGWERVTLPHTNRRLPWHSFDDRDYQFISTYRRHFRVPPDLDGQRIFVDFAGVMTAATVFINGVPLGEYRGGYTPFSFELTPHLDRHGDNVLSVEVDSSERADIPPFGGQIDYLTFGGIYREVALRAVAPTYIENVFAKPIDVLGDDRCVEVQCFLNSSDTVADPFRLVAELRDGDRVLQAAETEVQLTGSSFEHTATLSGLHDIQLWDLDHPHLYQVHVRLEQDGQAVDAYSVRIGFRDARFTPDGFYLNGRHLKLRGLNRHQTFPFVGQAMPARVQRRDALILKHDLKLNLVRTSHYPQSSAFLDCCDEIGLLVFEEIPGWQHVGDRSWQDIAICNVEEMIRRDWNHPSIILWGVRINESRDNHDFYTRTNAVAHALDDSRQTGGVRYFFESELLEDVFTINDFAYPTIGQPIHPLYFNTEFIGHTFPTKHIDNVERVQEHVFRHAHIHQQLGADNRYAGGVGWCAFDYNTHADFGSGDRICYHGVSDIFRIGKPAAGFYRSQCPPTDEIVLEPAFHWAIGDRSGGGGPGTGMICSNCDELKVYIGDELVAELQPDRERFGNLSHPPFFCDQLHGVWGSRWHDLRIDGYLGGQRVIEKRMSANGVDRQFHVEADDTMLLGDGIDMTRVVLRVTDEYGAARPFATGAVQLTLEGPGEIVGENPFALTGGVGAVWVKTREAAGQIRLHATHGALGTKLVEIAVEAAPDEIC
jgi:beta-galactosidase